MWHLWAPRAVDNVSVAEITEKKIILFENYNIMIKQQSILLSKLKNTHHSQHPKALHVYRLHPRI
jgi:hypothetical protein